MNMKSWIAATATALPLLAVAAYPDRPVTIVVPQQPGSVCDTLFRPIAASMTASLGQAVVIDNKVGAGGIIGTQFVARAKPDGYTLVCSSSTTFVTSVGAYKTLPYDPVKDFVSIGNVGKTSMMFVVKADFPARTLGELVSEAKRRDKSIDLGYGFATAQLASALLTSATGTQFNLVPYKGAPQLLTDLIGGIVSAGVVDVGNGAQHVKTGRIRALAITDAVRSPFAPEVPTLGESFPGVELVSWIGLSAPAGTPQPVLDRLADAVRQALVKPDVMQAFAAAGTSIAPMDGPKLDELIRSDIPKWERLSRAAGIERQ